MTRSCAFGEVQQSWKEAGMRLAMVEFETQLASMDVRTLQ